MKKIFKLVHNQARQGAIACINSPDYDGYVVTLQKPTRNLLQNGKLHACLRDISKQVKFMDNRTLSLDDTKRLLLDAFCRVRKAEGNPLSTNSRLVPSLDGTGVVQLGGTRNLSKADASEFIEYLIAWGVDQGVKFSDYE